MEQLLDKILSRPGLQTAQMVGGAVRTELAKDPKKAMSGLASWSEHTDRFVRIASGVGYGLVGTRDRNALPDVLPYVEKLANDLDPEVREHGASAALEQLWLVHTDAVSDTVEQWIAGKNDFVREVVIRTIVRIATDGTITRPTVLRRFIERGLAIYDRLSHDASPQVRAAIANAIDEMGCVAPDLVTPFVRDLAKRDEIPALRLVVELSRLPFAAACEDLDLAATAAKLKQIEAASRARAARWVREGVGTVDYLSLFVTEFTEHAKDDTLPWTHVADPYRGCQLRCEFCNARSLTEWVGDTPETFVRRVSVVRNAAEVLARELHGERMLPRAERVICIGADADPYQPAEERFEVTRELLKVCLELEHPVVVQTRQELILRDMDLIEPLAEKGLVNVLVAMQTAVEGIRNKVELGTSTVAERFRTIRMLSTKNVPVGLVLSPIMPELTDDEALLDETIRRAADAGARWIVAQVLDLKGSAGVKVRLFLESYIASLLPRYEEIYAPTDKNRAALAEYVHKMTQELVPNLAAKHGLDDFRMMLTSGRDPLACLVRR